MVPLLSASVCPSFAPAVRPIYLFIPETLSGLFVHDLQQLLQEVGNKYGKSAGSLHSFLCIFI